MNKWIVLYTENGERKCNYLSSKEDAEIVSQWYTVEGYENVEVMQCSPITDLSVLRNMAIGASPSVVQLALGRRKD